MTRTEAWGKDASAVMQFAKRLEQLQIPEVSTPEFRKLLHSARIDMLAIACGLEEFCCDEPRRKGGGGRGAKHVTTA